MCHAGARKTGRLQLTSGYGPLTLEQRRFNETNGYLVVRNVFGTGELDYIHERYKRILKSPNEFRGKVIGSIVRDIRIAKGEEDRSHLPAEYRWLVRNPNICNRCAVKTCAHAQTRARSRARMNTNDRTRLARKQHAQRHQDEWL